MPGAILYTARFAGPQFLERGIAQVATCAVYRDGAIVEPVSGTLTLTGPDGTVLVSAAAVTIADDGTAEYELAADLLTTQTLSEGWFVNWALVMPDRTAPYTFRRSAIVGRSALYPVITDADLYRRRSELRGLLPDGESYQDDIDEAFVEICHRLAQGGSLAHLIMDPESLRFVELYKTLAIIYGRFSTAPEAAADANWPELAKGFEAQYDAAFKGLAVKYDSTDTGKADANRRPAHPVTFLGAAGEDYDSWGPTWR